MKRIIRSRKDRIIAGVCGGFAEYFGLDPSLIRLAWIFFTLFGGSGILAYLLAMIVIPDELSAPYYERNNVTPNYSLGSIIDLCWVNFVFHAQRSLKYDLAPFLG